MIKMADIRTALDNEDSVLVDKPGDYVTTIEATDDHTSQTEGKCLKTKMRVTAGSEKDKSIVSILSIAPSAAWRLRQLVKA